MPLRPVPVPVSVSATVGFTFATPLSLCVVLALAACGAPTDAVPVTPRELPPPARDLERDLEHMDLFADTTELYGEAAIRVAAATSEALTLEVGTLDIKSVVTLDGVELNYEVVDSDAVALSPRLLDIGLPADEDTVVISYGFSGSGQLAGYSASGGYTFTFPGNCALLFPCHSDPADGLTWTVDVQSEAAVVITADVADEAPSYMLAWRESDALREIDVGTSDGGVALVAYTDDALEAAVLTGVERLPAMFNYLERVLGAYPFGARAGVVPAPWGPFAYGGMEHHPYWHVNERDLDFPLVNGHEAAHAWFGDSVRFACWEDVFMSEGIVSYLGLRAVEEAYGQAAGDADWDFWAANLRAQMNDNDHPVRPEGCNDVDPDAMLDFVVYGKGAFFLKAVAAQVGKDVLDDALGAFFAAHKHQPASVATFLTELDASTGFDSSELADAWLYGLGMPPAELGGI